MPQEEKKQNTKLNGFRFNDNYVKGLKTFDQFVAVYKKSAYADAPNQMELLQQAWDFFNPPKAAKEEKTGNSK